MEALLLWVPVLWYNDGATPELMDQTSWILINNKDIKTISKALKEWDNNSFHRSHIQKKARELYKKASNKLSTTKNSW
jgi:glycosyltransferase involved in cell wall biosynthesis